MRTLRSRLAFLLLLCFTRVLLPDAWVLGLHQHQHTLEEPAQATRQDKKQAKALLTARHQHCQTDHFYHVPFQPTPPLELPFAVVYARTEAVGGILGGAHRAPHAAYLRGPPGQA
ncbi:hypothetical protein SAMN00120144_2839 [Hymenobacter roseosalivarius DSM 11622]|uniref:Uncharacterized protein n=1 Tax=Hymenobacter roseosalivarius DSM 11622 TaxID=645990 RepID=A0A1W1UWP2_9BACT|nr:hypothetical protein [Hymenobacter roseosalivarius]SMB85568.1 hypothetical protein SAMN00120144_2839 [Hymenobacter roseosalivarius DSM 11622]